MLSVRFCGAARTVTGSQYFLEYSPISGSKFRFCIDSGMFQVGQKANLYKINSHLLFDPKQLDCIVLTHAHLDHCGRIPYLVKMGFGGRIYSTLATQEITEIVLRDAAKHQEDGMYTPDIGDILGDDNKGYERSQASPENIKITPTNILYGAGEVDTTMRRFKTFEYHQKFKIHDNLEVEFWDAGHIIGSAFVIIREITTGKSIAFSGDLGNINKPIINDPEMPASVPSLTHIFTESTYGNRLHGIQDPKEKLKKVIKKTLRRRGKVLIPSFSVERAQEIIYFLVELMREGKLDRVPIYLDSPMASKVLEVALNHPELYDENLRKKIDLNANPLTYQDLKILETSEESKTLNNRNKPCIIIAGSGMLNGGRILKHLMFNIDNPLHTLLFVGYQASGTLGRKILDGAKEIELENKVLEVKNEIAVINEFSAHADQKRLKKWIINLIKDRDHQSNPAVTVFLMHGEKDASLGLGMELEASLYSRVNTYWPHFGEQVTIWND